MQIICGLGSEEWILGPRHLLRVQVLTLKTHLREFTSCKFISKCLTIKYFLQKGHLFDSQNTINYLTFLLPYFYNFPLKATILLFLFMEVMCSQSGGQWENLLYPII